ncbi:hypothetical protein GQR58_020331 [Nymphon striatum]|nr:hypothetical protein GQR58_020331 [Nymphon striatum]
MQLFTLAFYKVLNSYCSTSTTDHHYRQNPMKLTSLCKCKLISSVLANRGFFACVQGFGVVVELLYAFFLISPLLHLLSKDVWIIPITRPALFTRLTILFLFVCILYCSELSFSIKPIVSVSSANLTMEHLRCSVRKSAVYKVNKNGASTVPCGAPVLVFIISEHNKELR